MGIRSRIRNVNNLTTIKADFTNQLSEGFLPPTMEGYVDGDVDHIFSGEGKIGFSQVDSFCFNPRTGELLVANRFDNTHYQIIDDYGTEKDANKYVLGYINFPGISRQIPEGWMTEMMRDNTISLRYEGSFYDKDDYDRVKRALDMLVKNGAPLDYKVIILFGEVNSGKGGFMIDRPNGTTLKYNNLSERKLLGY